MFYGKLTDPLVAPLAGLKPEHLRPTKGYILVALVPKKDMLGSIHIPAIAQSQDPFARVISVPDDDKCPCKPGDWVIFVNTTEVSVPFEGRDDIARVGYDNEAGLSDIVLVLDKSVYDNLPQPLDSEAVMTDNMEKTARVV